MNKKKLTTDIFSNPKCPKWARYATVNSMGCVYVYYSKPSIYEDKEQGIRIWCNSNVSPIVSTSSVGPTKYISDNYESSDWEHSLVERTEGWEPLSLFTADVFKQPMCPDCAKYAAVDKDGTTMFYRKEPTIDKYYGYWDDNDNVQLFVGYFDYTDWEHSLVKRPDHLTVDVSNLRYNKKCIVCKNCKLCKILQDSYEIDYERFQ